jgi:hypothetical protein
MKKYAHPRPQASGVFFRPPDTFLTVCFEFSNLGGSFGI